MVVVTLNGLKHMHYIIVVQLYSVWFYMWQNVGRSWAYPYDFSTMWIIIPREWTILAVEMEMFPLAAHIYWILIIEHGSAYHGVLGRPTLKELWAITSIHNLNMMFPIEHDIVTIRHDQMGSSVTSTLNVHIERRANPWIREKTLKWQMSLRKGRPMRIVLFMINWTLMLTNLDHEHLS